MNTRLNPEKDAKNWLSMQPNPMKFMKLTDFDRSIFGELDEDNRLHGRGIKLWNDGAIFIGYYQNGEWSTGNFIYIHDDGVFEVGEYYRKDGEVRERYTRYMTDGTEWQYYF
jgi:hypothetical protein